MKVAMVKRGGGEPRLAVVRDDQVLDIAALAQGEAWSAGVYEFIKGGMAMLQQLRERVDAAPKNAWQPIDSVEFAAPIPRPPKNVFCVGKNYTEHIGEGARAWGDAADKPVAPVIFTKAHTAIVGPGSPIRQPANTKELDYEGELAVVIGKGGRGIPERVAGEHVFGYMLLNDVTARDLQQRGPQWFLGKSCDTFCPTGPWVLVADPAVAQPDLEIRVTVNGEERQRFRTRDMIFDIPAIVAEVSRNITLEPGDIIATGTGPGGGFAQDPPNFLRQGDTVTVEADGLGSLSNRVV